jgi:H+/Cl- antiporter ClcA
LSIGAAIGACLGRLIHQPVAACVLIGMAAFLSGSIQAPITSFVIIFEMTGHHQMLLPIMLASLLAFISARLVGAAHLYQSLAAGYGTHRSGDFESG